MYKFAYLLSLVAIIFGGSIYIGPATPRQYMAVIMVLLIFANIKRIYKFNVKFLITYIIFLLFYGVSAIYEGKFSEYIREFISLYLVGLACYFATIVYYNKYRTFSTPLFTLYSMGIVNTAINLLQYLNHPIGIALGSIFVNVDNEQKMSMFKHLAQGVSGSLLFGLLGDPVLNGYFSMLIPLLALYYVRIRKGIVKLIHWGIFAISLLALLLIQQRAAFLITGVLSVYVLIKQYGLKKEYLFISVIAIIALIFLLPIFFESSMFTDSRFASGEEDSRIELYTKAILYILQNPLTGGLTGFMKYSGNQPHNVLFNAFIYGGVIGGFCILKMLFTQLRRCLYCLNNNVQFYLTLLFSAYTLNGFLHNPSLVTGDALLWILWGMLYISSINTINYRKQ